jgi:hypothetical protein
MADARGSGPRERKLMGVQIPPSAPNRDTMATGYGMAETTEYLIVQHQAPNSACQVASCGAFPFVPQWKA